MTALPQVAIVGFPNVGKSTLFNRLLGRRKALVHSLPGMTRDVVTARCTLAGKTFRLTDTGGLFGVAEEPLSEKVREKAWEAAREADVVLLVLDGKRDMAPAEEELYASLRKLGKPVLVVVNKVDSPLRENELGDFYRLGAERIFPVSAEHNVNVGELAEAVAETVPAGPGAAAEEPEPLRIAVIGRVNVGKSSLINRLAGEERLLVSEVPGTTRDSTDTLIVRNRRPYCLVDTAGIRKMAGAADDREKAGIVRAKSNIRRADVLCQVLDVQEFPTRQDTHIAHLAAGSGKPLMLALNKWDLVEGPKVDPEDVRRKVHERLSFVDYAPLLFVSAKTGQRVVKILDLADEVDANAAKQVPTGQLNAFLERLAAESPLRGRSGARVKVMYMTQSTVRPPSFLLFAHADEPLAPASERNLVARLREEFGLEGTPLRVRLRRS